MVLNLKKNLVYAVHAKCQYETIVLCECEPCFNKKGFHDTVFSLLGKYYVLCEIGQICDLSDLYKV